MSLLTKSDALIDLTPGRTAGNVWVQSDLQLGKPELARQVLAEAVTDMTNLGEPIDAIWCLGDALVGKNLEALEQVAEACVELLEPLGVPICYVLGNHEMDLFRETGVPRFPLYEQAVERPLWHTMDRLDQPWFERRCFGSRVVFFGDHADPDGEWCTSHHQKRIGPERYPYGPEVWRQLRDEIADVHEPVITAGHYAYPGGQRPSPLLADCLPVPDTVRLHMYGHAHIGDLVHNGERPYQRDNPIKGQSLRQYNISALETARTAGSHSVLLRFQNGLPTRLDVRCHLEHKWLESFELNAHPTPAGS
ncbi:metallophosphoesterase [Phycisphaerales bacterium AB-hyl4]|uniref:Metallophosphoesterase n=1 Tax=Natronomicrosphaera hydrolytica TaxID=3242702 RepID=A0ABV4U9P2_9BACT